MVLAVGPGASQEQNLGALSMAILTREVESCVSCLETAGGKSQSLVSVIVHSCCQIYGCMKTVYSEINIEWS